MGKAFKMMNGQAMDAIFGPNTSFGEHRMGTSIMAVSYTGDGGGVVLGADSRPDMTRAECEEFVKNGLALAMARDGSSGGVIRLCTISEAGQERQFFSGEDIPKFWEG